MTFFEELKIENILDRLKISLVDWLHNDQLGKLSERKEHVGWTMQQLCAIVCLFLSSSSAQYKHCHSIPTYINRRCLYLWSTLLPCSPFVLTTVHIFFSTLLAISGQCFPSMICCPEQHLQYLDLWLITFFRQFLSMSLLPAKGQLLMSRLNCGQSFYFYSS